MSSHFFIIIQFPGGPFIELIIKEHPTLFTVKEDFSHGEAEAGSLDNFVDACTV